MRIEDLDLADLADRIRVHVADAEPPVGYLRGRSYFRDVVAHLLDCSDVEAEDLVDTLQVNGYLHFEGNPAERSQAQSRWRIDPHVP